MPTRLVDGSWTIQARVYGKSEDISTAKLTQRRLYVFGMPAMSYLKPLKFKFGFINRFKI